MRLACFRRWAVFPLLAWLAVSCGSLDPQADAPRFHESETASLVLLYNNNQNIFITRPDTRENGFLPLMSRDDVVRKLDRLDMGHDLAVIVVANMRTAEEDEGMMSDWQSVLGTHGFRRVVFLRAGYGDELDGLLVMRDLTFAGSDLSTR